MSNVVAAVGGRETPGRARLWQDCNARHKSLMLAFRFCNLVILGISLAFCGYSYAEQVMSPEEQKEKLISITLGETTFKLPSPVLLDGKWVDHDAQGTGLDFSIRAAELYKRFDSAAEDNPNLLRERFEIYLVNVKGSDINKRKSNELSYIKDGKWAKIYPDTALGLLVYEPVPRLALGWGSPTYYPLDEKYVDPDGTPFRITCTRVYENTMPTGCRFHYFVSADVSMTFNFSHIEENLKHWRELDQALRQTLNTYMEK